MTRASSAASSTIAPSSSRTRNINPDLPQGGTALWRLDVGAAGSGVTGICWKLNRDTALWLHGPIDGVCAHDGNLARKRKHT